MNVDSCNSDAADHQIVGYVEAVTSQSVLGWVWQRGCTDPVTVELSHGETVISRCSANGFRPDLARSGIGSGRHSFDLAIPLDFVEGRQNLVVSAVTDEGGKVELTSPPPQPSHPTGHDHLERSVEMLLASQRVLHRNIQAALIQQRTDGIGAQTIRTELQQKSDLLEMLLIRVESGLGNLVRSDARPSSRKIAALICGFAITSFLASLTALIMVVSRG